MIVEVLQGACIVALAATQVFVVLWVRKALGLRSDWKRRFDRMKEMLGL